MGGKEFKTVDRGQRYEIRCMQGRTERVIGWSDDRDAFSNMVKQHPSWSKRRVVDRQRQLYPKGSMKGAKK